MKEALQLMRLVERGESERNIAYCDSLIPVREKEVETLKAGFVLERDARYEEVGRYVRPEHAVERNIGRSYLRCGVNEQGEIFLASVYSGGAPINHTGLKSRHPTGRMPSRLTFLTMGARTTASRMTDGRQRW